MKEQAIFWFDSRNPQDWERPRLRSEGPWTVKWWRVQTANQVENERWVTVWETLKEMNEMVKDQRQSRQGRKGLVDSSFFKRSTAKVGLLKTFLFLVDSTFDNKEINHKRQIKESLHKFDGDENDSFALATIIQTSLHLEGTIVLHYSKTLLKNFLVSMHCQLSWHPINAQVSWQK